jgi:hypothetical protein
MIADADGNRFLSLVLVNGSRDLSLQIQKVDVLFKTANECHLPV